MSPPGFTATAAALAILLSVIVRWIRSGISWQAVEDGTATADVLADITGITDFEKLQEVFGPPRLADGVFPVTRQEVMRQRTGLGYLIGDRWLDGGSALISAVSLLPVWPMWQSSFWLSTLLTFAFAYQICGWLASTRLMKRR
jgi:hypothetical protein